MNFGLRKMQISSAAVPPIRIRPISAAARPARAARASASATRSRPTPREPFTSTVSPGRSSAGSSAAAARGVGDARAPRRRTPSAISAAQRADGDEQRRRRARRACAPISRCKRALVAGPSSSMSPSTATRRAGRGRGEVVERGAHRHRVGVVAVVDQRRRRPAARCARRAAPRSATSTRPVRLDPERARGGHRGEQVAQVVGLRERRLELDPLARARRSRRAVRASLAASARRRPRRT